MSESRFSPLSSRGCQVLLLLAVAVPSHISIDLSSLGGADFQLQMALYDNSPLIGDSWALPLEKAGAAIGHYSPPQVPR
jgi:hypothetical protein